MPSNSNVFRYGDTVVVDLGNMKFSAKVIVASKHHCFVLGNKGVRCFGWDKIRLATPGEDLGEEPKLVPYPKGLRKKIEDTISTLGIFGRSSRDKVVFEVWRSALVTLNDPNHQWSMAQQHQLAEPAQQQLVEV